MRAGIVIIITIACGRSVENVRHTRLIQPGQGILQSLREAPTSPAVVGNHHVLPIDILHFVEVFDTLDSIGSGTTATRVEELASSYTDRPVDSHNPCAVVPRCADGARYVAAVAVVVQGVTATRDRVDPVNVINVPITIVVDAVAGSLPRVGPHISDQVRVIVFHARIDDPDDDAS